MEEFEHSVTMTESTERARHSQMLHKNGFVNGLHQRFELGGAGINPYSTQRCYNSNERIKLSERSRLGTGCVELHTIFIATIYTQFTQSEL